MASRPPAGPQGLADRGSEREGYTGNYLRAFKLYHRDVFCDELRGLRPDLRPETATEREFMDALAATNARLMQWSMYRGVAASSVWCSGPKCFPHRLDVDRLRFVPPAVASEPAARCKPADLEDVGWLCCGVSGCSRWRRVDRDTLRVFSNRIFFNKVWCEAPRRWVAAAAARRSGR